MEVNYEYFNPVKLLHTTIWRFWRAFIFLFFAVPVIIQYHLGFFKRWEKRKVEQRRKAKEEKAAQ